METFGRFDLHQQIGSGGMAEVYLARSRDGLPRPGPLVVKRLLKELESVPRAVELFENEGHIGTTLRHPDIVPVFEMGLVERRHYLVMELVDGPDAARLLTALSRQGRTLGMALAGTIILPTLRALHHAHFAVRPDGQPLGLIHRDVSPDNLFCMMNGRVLLSDFGIAKMSALEFFTDPRLGVRGKLPFMAPERVMGSALDGRSDQFSAALIFAELCSGSRLYAARPEESFLQLRDRVAARKLKKPREVMPSMTRRLESVLMRALEPEITHRYRTCAEFAAALEEVLGKDKLLAPASELGTLLRELWPKGYFIPT